MPTEPTSDTEELAKEETEISGGSKFIKSHKFIKFNKLDKFNNIDQKPYTDISWINKVPMEGWWSDKHVVRGGDKTDKVRRYAVISGEVDADDRIIVQDIFNTYENRYGLDIELLIVSAAAAEGLDFKNIRHIHIMEPYWNWGRIMQIISRGVRNDSHIDLPPEEKNVQPYIYLAVPPLTEQLPDGGYAPTTDTELYEESLKDEAINISFNEAIDDVSIECEINAESKCRKCSPTNEPLFTDDPARDAKTDDPCREVVNEKVKATEIQIGETKYYYTANDKSAFGISIFVYDEHVNSWRQMRESDPVFIDIVDAVGNLNLKK
jgi:hypothetical protein